MPKILITTSSFNLDNFIEKEALEKAGYEFVLNPYGKRLTEEQVSELIDEQVVAMIAGVEPLTESVLNNSSSLKVISRCGVGMDNVDINTAKSLGISIFNTPDAPTHAVAELTLAHIFSLSRRISECDRLMRQGKWQPLMGSLISGKTVGIIGLGRIGKMVAKILLGMGANVVAFDITGECIQDNINHVNLDELLAISDIVTLHVPYNSETHELINSEKITLMKPTALLINVARGNLVDENALLFALQKDQLAGAAIDCFSDEPYNGPLLQCDNVQFTAHMGSYAKETRSMMEAEACRNLVEGLKQHGLF